MGSERDGVWRCQECGEMVEPMSPKWRMAGDRWQHHHGYPIGHVDATYFGDATITIPLAEYEGLQRRAKFWGAVAWDDVWAGLMDWRSFATSDAEWDCRTALADALAAAIKEQEG